MSADAASLPCPLCLHASAFESVQTLRDRLIFVSTNMISCPMCQEEICGLDKLTIHLFSHVQLLISKEEKAKEPCELEGKIKFENDIVVLKKPRSSTKNKSTSSRAATPVKFVKIYPKLPVVSLKPLPIIDITQMSTDDRAQGSEPICLKAEAAIVPTNTTCDICGLQFVDANILRMHKCLIHNIGENTHQTFTRYNCHLCPKNFKMRGSLMVHLRVAHYGFLTGTDDTNDIAQKTSEGNDTEENRERSANSDRHDNKQWQCDVCRKFFTTKYFLKKHKRLHTGETPYACTQCNKTFTFQQSYHKHLLYHNDEKPHTCTYCGRAFKELSTLHNHQRIHTGEKPFKCETCGKCFRQRVSYLVHRRIHTGAMPYKCTACEKCFRYKVSQRTHKCQAQPPGTVVRQTGDLVEKLKKKRTDSNVMVNEEQTKFVNSITFMDVSEANAELVRTGAKLSLEDMESENFCIITDDINSNIQFANGTESQSLSEEASQAKHVDKTIFNTNFEDLIGTTHLEEKDVPSPSEILKNLTLSQEDDIHTKKVDLFKDLNIYL